MRYFKYYILVAVVIIISIVVALFWGKFNFGAESFPVNEAPLNNGVSNNEPSSGVMPSPGAPLPSRPPSQPAQFCPQPEDLIKDGFKWTTKDKKWENYTPSSATKVLGFVGAQWVGIKVGKVICLYQTNEAVSFPVALEQTRSQLVLEPKTVGWSALVGNRRFCKSANTADCSFFFEPPKDISNIYKEIEYVPDAERGGM